MRTLVIQSHRPGLIPDWLALCLASVRSWADKCGYDYRCYGDEALELTPAWYQEKLAGREPIVADLARLLLIREALAHGYEQACWIDADVLLFAPERLRLSYPQTCAFGREYWVAADASGSLRVRRNVHNAICVFKAGCPVLPFLAQVTEQIIRRVDPGHIAPQLVGPKLLSALHNIAGFDLIESVGAFSPAIVDELECEPGLEGRPAVALLRERTPTALAGANLCVSLNGDRDLGGLCARLQSGILAVQ